MSTKKKETPEPSFENSLQRLQEIMQKLESGDVPLEDSLKMYEEGLTLSKACMEKLNQAELKLKRLSKDMEGHFRLVDEEREEE